MQMRLISYLLLALLLFAGCGERRNAPQDQTKTKPITSETGDRTTLKTAGSVLFRLNPQIGKEYIFKNTVLQTITQTIDSQKVNTTHNQTIVYSLKAKRYEPNESITFDVAFKSIEQQIATPMLKIEASTLQKNQKPTPLEIFYRTLIGKNFRVKVSPDGKDVQLAGTDSIIGNVLKNISRKKEFVGIDRSTLEQLIQNFFNPQDFKRGFEKLFEIYPTKPITIGESWEITHHISEPIPTKVLNKFQLQNISGDTLLVQLTSKVGFDKPQQQANQPSIQDIKGTQSGTLYVDKNSGLIFLEKIHQSVKIIYTIPASPQTNNKLLTIPTDVSTTFLLEIM
jgi:hypothetical protein